MLLNEGKDQAFVLVAHAALVGAAMVEKGRCFQRTMPERAVLHFNLPFPPAFGRLLWGGECVSQGASVNNKSE